MKERYYYQKNIKEMCGVLKRMDFVSKFSSIDNIDILDCTS